MSPPWPRINQKAYPSSDHLPNQLSRIHLNRPQNRRLHRMYPQVIQPHPIAGVGFLHQNFKRIELMRTLFQFLKVIYLFFFEEYYLHGVSNFFPPRQYLTIEEIKTALTRLGCGDIQSVDIKVIHLLESRLVMSNASSIGLSVNARLLISIVNPIDVLLILFSDVL